MPKYEIYYGVTEAQYAETREFSDEDEAMIYAYNEAVAEYESYGGMHGLMDWEACYEDCEESGWLEGLTEDQIQERVNDHYNDQITSWMDYYVILVE